MCPTPPQLKHLLSLLLLSSVRHIRTFGALASEVALLAAFVASFPVSSVSHVCFVKCNKCAMLKYNGSNMQRVESEIKSYIIVIVLDINIFN